MITGKRTTIVALTIVLLLAVFLRVFMQREELFYPDSCIYLSMAENMKQGVISRSLFPTVSLHQPLYSLLTAAVSLAGFTMEAAGMVVSVISGLGLVLVLFFTGRRLAGDGAGLTAALLAAGDPALVKYSTELLTEALFLCLFYLVLLLVLRAGETWRPLLTVGCGMLAAAAFGARFIGLAALPAALCWVVWLGLRTSPDSDRPRFRRAAAAGLLVLLGFALAASPVLLRNRVVRGQWSLTGFASHTPARQAPAVAGRQGDESRDKHGMFRDWLEQYRGMRADNAVDLSLGGYLNEFWRVFRESVPLAWSVLALAGIVLLLMIRGAAGLFPAGYLASWLLLPMGITFVAQSASGNDEISRYLTPVLPTLLLLAAIGLASLATWTAGLLERQQGQGSAAGGRSPGRLGLIRQLAPLGAGLLLVLLLDSGPLQAMKTERETAAAGTSWVSGARELAAAVKDWSVAAGIQKPTLMDRKPFVAYFSGSWWQKTPNQRARHLVTACYRSKTHLLVVDSAAVALSLPKLAPLVSGERIPPGLRLVYHRIFPAQERVLAIYQVLYHNRVGREGMARLDGLDDFPDTTAEEHALIGRRLYAEGQVHLAGLHLQRAVEIRPDFAEAWYQLGAVYFLKSLYLLPEQRHHGVFHKAIFCYGEAAGLSPRLAAMARKEVATIERNLPRPQLSMVYGALGRLYRERGREREALSAFRRALSLDPRNKAARDELDNQIPGGSMELSGQT
jgi:4-amino-4-deoxy-L-arabinose transferase-like glycosyltransferase